MEVFFDIVSWLGWGALAFVAFVAVANIWIIVTGRDKEYWQSKNPKSELKGNKILFISNYFPPEVNASATRLYENAKQWVQDGHDVEVLTSNPNFPEGRIYEGYKNRFSQETIQGIKVTRIPILSSNGGILRRTFSYLSFMALVPWYARRVQQPDVVVATSPQFFTAVAGYLVARLKSVPFVLEIRDLWPESVVVIGGIRRSAIIRFFERIEQFLYKKADHIVALTNAFKKFIIAKGIDPNKITVLSSGADVDVWNEPLEAEKLATLRRKYNLEGKFIASYIGTIGIAQRADVLLEAAQQCTDSEIVFMVVGTGAKREMLEARQAVLQQSNFRLVDKVSRDELRYLMALTDVSIIHLKESPLFKWVIPSNIFAAMASRTPIVLGVEGEAKELLDKTKEIVEDAGAGIAIPPENAEKLVEAVLRLKNDKDLRERMAKNGYYFVSRYHNSIFLARRYMSLLANIAHKEQNYQWESSEMELLKTFKVG